MELELWKKNRGHTIRSIKFEMSEYTQEEQPHSILSVNKSSSQFLISILRLSNNLKGCQWFSSIEVSEIEAMTPFAGDHQ